MEPLLQALTSHARRIVDTFYAALMQQPKSRHILATLAPQELAHLKARQVENLIYLATPNLNAYAYERIALGVGRVHAITGLDKEDLTHGLSLLMEIIQQAIGDLVPPEELAEYNRRLTDDLGWQLKAYQQLYDSQQDTLVQLIKKAWKTELWSDFIQVVVSTLAAHEEIAACAIGRPDAQGRLHFEATASYRTEHQLLDMLATLDSSVNTDDATGYGPSGLAWRSGRVERAANLRTEATPLPWHQAALARGLRSCAAVPLHAAGKPAAVLVLFSSMPGALGGAHQETFIELLQTLLGSAMARLKNLGGDSQAISIPMRQHWAMLLRSDSLVMHYQPQFNLRTGRVTKVEALARLHDNGRAVRPNEFLPALTSDDLLELYARGLNHALSDRQRWIEQGQDLGIAINMPPAALHDRRYFETTVTAMRAHACPVDRLTLEMLETEEVSSGVDVAGMLSRFKALGVQLAEDDLGSGYSGLSRLRDMPFDVIKIDRSLATLTEGDPSIVLRFIYQLVRLGHTLGKQTIVEGVENVDLLEAITLLGADVVQGYVIAHPMPAEDLMLWLRSDADARLNLPDPRRPRSLLAKLARLLIWEERLHLLLHDKQDAPAFSPSLARAIALESSLREPSIHQYLGLPFTGKLQLQSAVQAQETLFHAALAHGLTSADYRTARDELVSLLTDDEPTSIE